MNKQVFFYFTLGKTCLKLSNKASLWFSIGKGHPTDSQGMDWSKSHLELMGRASHFLWHIDRKVLVKKDSDE